MIKKILFYLAVILAIGALIWYYVEIGRRIKVKSDSTPISHTTWTQLLKTHVQDGRVDYKGIQTDRDRLDSYLSILSKGHPNDAHWSKEEQLAYWINAYNAFTVQLILDHYPVKSIREIKEGVPFINSVWDLDFIVIEGRRYSLNDIEHRILRREFAEPRIHFAIVCASISCPKLRNEAFEANQLDPQLENQAVDFLTDPIKNQITADQMAISRIFLWFRNDFTKDQTIQEFINPFLPVDLTNETPFTYLEYDWGLNE
ncbi:MAG: DUF547 domain-containing protein [Bacteroidota bacterium]